MTRRYLLEIDDTQAEVLIRATELLSRIQTGQVMAVAEEFTGGGVQPEALDQSRDLLNRVHTLLTGLPDTSGLSILHPKVPESARVSYDLYQVIRHRIGQDRGPAGRLPSGWRDDPMKTSGKCRLATITEVEPVAGEP